MWRIVLLIALLILPVAPSIVSAATTSTVTITAIGVTVAAPGGFILTYVSDYEVNISWTKPVGALNTMVRAAYGRAPTSVTDGYEVYYGVGDNFNDTSISLTTPDVIYYAAWSRRADGVWSPLWATADTENFMSASFAFIGLLLLSLCMLIVGLLFKSRWILFIDFFSWLFSGMYALAYLSVYQYFMYYIGILFIIISLAVGWASLAMFKQPQTKRLNQNDPETWDEEDYQERVAEVERRKRLS